MIEGKIYGTYPTLDAQTSDPVFNTGLGNQLFIYAATRTVAEKRGYNFYIKPSLWQGHGLFDVDFGKIDGELKYKFVDSKRQKYNPEIFNVRDFTLLEGYFQTDRYFDHHKVLDWFRLKVSDDEYDYDEYCFMHVRSGDYELPPWNKIQLPTSYYEEAKYEMKQINHNLKFIVVTNDKKHTEKYFPNDEVVSNTMEKDFVLLNSAKYLVISNSSFAWWAAWLNHNNTVIAPQGWYGYNTNKEFGPVDIKVNRWRWI